MHNLEGILAGQLSIQTGRIVDFAEDGFILVETKEGSSLIRTHFLRTSREAPPSFHIGDRVLVAVDLDVAEGYVLGAIAQYLNEQESGAAHQNGDANEIVDVVLPRNARCVRVHASQIHLEAGDEIQIKCGDGTIMIDKRGKIVIRGNNIVSRARQSNKLKGASVAIN